MNNIYYKEPVYRPPAEANSLLIQATEGCTYNCEFCIGNEGKKFLIRNINDIKKDIYTASLLYGDSARKMFLLDGNAFVMKPEALIEIANFSFNTHKNLTRIGSYAHARDILNKSDEDLKAIAESGIKIVYLGIESGDDELLKRINKRITSNEIAEAAYKLYKAGITLSATVILGLTGSNETESVNHAINTALLINKIKPPTNIPWYISTLSLMIPKGTPLYRKMQIGKFKPMTNIEILQEMKILMENLDDNLEKCIFRSNHSSNYLSLESNNLARNKSQLVEKIDYALKNPEIMRFEYFRGL